MLSKKTELWKLQMFLYSSPAAAVTNYNKLRHLTHYKCVLSQTRMLEVWKKGVNGDV